MIVCVRVARYEERKPVRSVSVCVIQGINPPPSYIPSLHFTSYSECPVWCLAYNSSATVYQGSGHFRPRVARSGVKLALISFI